MEGETISRRICFAAILAWYNAVPHVKLTGTVEQIREGASKTYYKSIKYGWYEYFASPGRLGGRVKSDVAAPFNWHMTVRQWVRVEVREAKRILRSLSLEEWWAFEFEPHPRAFPPACVVKALSLPVRPRPPSLWLNPPKCYICDTTRVDSDFARHHAINHDVCGFCRRAGFLYEGQWFHIH